VGSASVAGAFLAIAGRQSPVIQLLHYGGTGFKVVRELDCDGSGVTALVGFSQFDDLLSGTADGGVRVWDTRAGVAKLKLPAHEKPVTALHLAVVSDLGGEMRGLLFAAHVGAIRAWDATAGCQLFEFEYRPPPPASRPWWDRIDGWRAMQFAFSFAGAMIVRSVGQRLLPGHEDTVEAVTPLVSAGIQTVVDRKAQQSGQATEPPATPTIVRGLEFSVEEGKCTLALIAFPADRTERQPCEVQLFPFPLTKSAK
jgi:hypothetical protein